MARYLDSRNRWRIFMVMRVSKGLLRLKTTQLLPKQHPTYLHPISFKWLTGQQHKSLNGEKVEITVDFDHQCLNRNLITKYAFRLLEPVEKTFYYRFHILFHLPKNSNGFFCWLFAKGKYSRRVKQGTYHTHEREF